MKIAIVYFSQTGKTRAMAEEIMRGINSVGDIEVKAFELDGADKEFINESSAIIFGTPTYLASMSWQMKKWLDESTSRGFAFSGKLGAAFSTAQYIQGGADNAIIGIIPHLLVKGMLVYSGGAALGQPFIHLGPVATSANFDQAKDLFYIFGQRIAHKTSELFGQKPEEK